MKMMIKVIFFLIILAIITPIALLGYFGFIPGLSVVFGTNKPRDLGVKYTQLDLKSAQEGNGFEIIDFKQPVENIAQSVRFEGSKEVKKTFTSAELTALGNSRHWKYGIAKDLQYKINPDGTGEISGKLNVKNALTYLTLTYPKADIEKYAAQYHLGLNPPFYLKGMVKVKNNQISISPQILEIGRFPIPSQIVAENVPLVTKYLQDRLAQIPRLDIRELTVSNSQVNFDGTVPQKEFDLTD